jgi:hypothetical protein
LNCQVAMVGKSFDSLSDLMATPASASGCTKKSQISSSNATT